MAKPKNKTITLLRLLNGEEHEIVKETGKYYFCHGKRQFRKGNPIIGDVIRLRRGTDNEQEEEK